MRIGRTAGMLVGSFFLAAATGQVMQGGIPFGSTIKQVSLTSTDAVPASPAILPDEQANAAAVLAAIPQLPDFPKISTSLPSDGVRLAMRMGDSTSDYVAPMTIVSREYDTYGKACAAPAMTLSHLKPAMLSLSISAPCHPDEVIHLRHGALAFTARTDASGRYSVTLPAMATKGEVTVEMAQGVILRDMRLVPDIGAVRRFALAAPPTSDLHLNAVLAPTGTTGETLISSAAPGLPTLGLGGFMTLLGDPSLPQSATVEVLTTPANQPSPRIEILANVTDQTCGRDLLATTLSANGSVMPTSGAVSFAMPDCNATGQHLVMDVADATRAVAMAMASTSP